MKKRGIIIVSIVSAAFVVMAAAIIIPVILLSGGNGSSLHTPVMIDGTMYEQRIGSETWSGEYHKDTFRSSGSMNSVFKVVNYKDYVETVKSVNMYSAEEIDPFYTDSEKNYIVLSSCGSNFNYDLAMLDFVTSHSGITVYGHESSTDMPATGAGYLIVIPTDRPVGTKVDYVQCYNADEIENLRKQGVTYDTDDMMVYKPVIYIYPEKETDLTVELVNKDSVTCTYPKYDEGWTVTAQPDGTLKDKKTGRELYSLYYENESNVVFTQKSDGFVVPGEDSAAFLEEKLAVLGLTEKEAEEFIIYWLPILESNRYNYIRFADADEIEKKMPLKISERPDTVIRVLMTFKGLDEPVQVKEQKLTPAERSGVTVVEGGGTRMS